MNSRSCACSCAPRWRTGCGPPGPGRRGRGSRPGASWRGHRGGSSSGSGVPQRGRPHLLARGGDCEIPLLRLPMSCSRKSENGKKSTPSSAATSLEPVRMAGKWQSAQPIPRNIPCPSFASREKGRGGGGARNVMKSASYIIARWCRWDWLVPDSRRAGRRRPAGGSREGRTGL